MEEKQTWTCACGAKNTGKFCAQCGKEQSASANTNSGEDMFQKMMAMQMQMKQMDYQEEEKRKAEEEKRLQLEKEKQQKINDYNFAVASVPENKFKALMTSPLFLILTILAFVSLGLTVISQIASLVDGFNFMTVIPGIINIVLAILASLGFWKAYKGAKDNDDNKALEGLKKLKGVFTFSKVMTYIAIGFVLITVIILLATAQYLMQGASDMLGGDATEAKTVADNIMIWILLVVLIVAAVMILYYESVTKFAKHAIDCFAAHTAPTKNVLLASIFFFILGGFSIISLLVMVGATSLINEVTTQIGIEQNIVSIDAFTFISNVVNAGTYTIAGILGLMFNKLPKQIAEEINNIPKPEELQ